MDKVSPEVDDTVQISLDLVSAYPKDQTIPHQILPHEALLHVLREE